MVRMMLLLLGLASVLLATGAARAQDVIADQFYGSGVHRYFSGDLRSAHGDFTGAIQAGTDDPRPYYYRALTSLRMGRSGEARADLRQAADLEAADINGSYEVSKALERVQGRLRLQLEGHRRQARAIAQQRQEQQRRQRYAAARRFENQRVERASAIEDQPPARAFAPPAEDTPFRDDTAPAPFSAPPADALRPSADEGTPFGAPPAPAESPADAPATPFGAPPAEQEPPAEQPAAESSSPFGVPAVPADTPAAPATTPADSASPFGTPVTPADEPGDAAATPFGAPTTPPDAAGDPPANPFGNPITPATPAAGPGNAADATTENPFGGPPATATEKAVDSGFTVTADMPLGTPAGANAATAGGQSPTSKPSASGGLFRALRRAAGIDAAADVVGSAAKALPLGGSRRGSAQKAAPPRAVPIGAPPVVDGAPAKPTPDQDSNPFNEAAPGNAAPPNADNPFGPADGAAPPADNPFGAPPGDTQPEPPGANPFQDDPVQPGPPPASAPR